MKKTFFSYVLGCRVNEAEKEMFDLRLIEAGFSQNEINPFFCIINSCAVTNKAERETRQLIYQLKRKFPQAKIVLTGCSATYWKKLDLGRDLPIDLLVDNLNKKYLVKFIVRRLLHQPSFDRGGQKQLGQITYPISKFLKSGRAIIKIQDGCHRFCSYCIVPYLRGTQKSYLIKDIIDKINSLTDIQEVILTAINTEAFGYDTDENLSQLIDLVINKASISRISFGSIHPLSIDQNFLNFYRKILNKHRLVNFFHIPLQSGCDKTLKLMKRGYTAKEFAWKIKEIKKINPYALVATDVIVGFLDESDKDFEDSCRFLKTNPIDKFHVFRFSNRDKTAAYHMRKRLSEASSEVKAKRAKALAALSQKKYQQFLQFLVDNKYRSKALFIDKFEDGHQQALLDNQVPVWVKTSKIQPGFIKRLSLTKFENNKLIAEIH